VTAFCGLVVRREQRNLLVHPIHYNDGGGIKLGDPAFEKDPKLRALKKHVYFAIIAFVLGLLLGMGGLFLAMQQPRFTVPLMVVAAVIVLLSWVYIGYVVVAVRTNYSRYYAETTRGR
jgi:hypothetical protein